MGRRMLVAVASGLGLAVAGDGGGGGRERGGRGLRRVRPRGVPRRGRAEGLPGPGPEVRRRGRGLELRHHPPRVRGQGPEGHPARRRDDPRPSRRGEAERRGDVRDPGARRHRSDGGPDPPSRVASPRERGAGLAASGRFSRPVPGVERVRRIVDHLLPPYLAPSDVRVYVIENPEWNAFAMGNYSIYVFSGLLDAMDDDEVAIVLGHELVHATHEHSRRQAKKGMWIQLAAAGALGADLHASTAGAPAPSPRPPPGWPPRPGATGTGGTWRTRPTESGSATPTRRATTSPGGRGCGRSSRRSTGRAAPTLNFFFSNHSQAAVRAANLEREIALNYPEGWKPDGPARRAAVRPHPAAPIAAPELSPSSTRRDPRRRRSARG